MIKSLSLKTERWPIYKLGNPDISHIIMGQSPRSSTYNKEGKGISFLQGKTEFGEIYPDFKLFCSDPIKIAVEGDILISVRAPVGDLNISSRKCCIGRGLAAIRPSKAALYYLYLFYLLKLYKRFIESISTGSTFKAIKRADIVNLEIPLPPLPEQKKIAEVLSTMDLAIEELNNTIRKLERLKKELIRKLFTEGIENHILKKTAIGKIPQSWNISKLGILGELQYGYTCSASTENTGIKFLRITDIKPDGRIHWDSVPYCNINDQEFNKHSIKKEDILFARIGASTGKTAFIELNTRGVFASYLIRFVRKVDNIKSKYLFYFTQSRKYWSQVNRYKEGQLKKGLNASILSNIVIPIPPIREQKKISEFLYSLDYRLELLSKRKERRQLIKKGLMNDLLTGRKRVRLES